MGSNLGGHNTGAKAVLSEKTRPVRGMKDGSLFGSSLASAFASFGVEGASFSIAGGAAVLLLGSKGSNVLLLLGSKLAWPRGRRTRTQSRAPATPRRRHLGAVARPGERELATARAAPAASVGGAAASKLPEPVGTARAASSGRGA